MISAGRTIRSAALVVGGLLIAGAAIAAPIRDQKAFSNCLDEARFAYTAAQVDCQGRAPATISGCLYQASIDYGGAISKCKIADEQSKARPGLLPPGKGGDLLKVR